MGGFGVFWGDGPWRRLPCRRCRGRGVYAHGGAAGGADALGIDADDLAELADDHHLGGVVDELDAGDFADFGGGTHVDDALAAAGLEAVAVDVGALAEAVVGDGEDEAGGEAELFVELGELGGGFGGELGSGDGVVGAGELEGSGGGGVGGLVEDGFDLVLEALGGG